jgi:hypothetical protein
MNITDAIPVTHAAGILGVGSKTLFREMRARGILQADNTPAQEYRNTGELLLRFAVFHLGRTGIRQTKATPYVTVAGWHLVETIARDIRNGTTKAPAPVRSGNISTANQHTAPGSTATNTGTPAPPHFHALAASF